MAKKKAKQYRCGRCCKLGHNIRSCPPTKKKGKAK